ncbi:uncharacterized protein LOC126379594 [Pectinophora gossypiella]|uniref:uncharacterized protein LOC126379594 n=1 Tax=Pectinophora gossypiella TaxID=13191 RepID=UPI00214E5323|nr:uncharacterized protein LOC126379594 [Pectinophora gossypiella]
MSMDEEKLIGLVQDHRELYDIHDRRYDDHHRREEVWREIGRMMSVSADKCKARWKRIRDNYRRARKLRRRKSSQGAKMIKCPRHEKLLHFLNPYLELNKGEKVKDIPPESLDVNISEGISTPESSIGSSQSNNVKRTKKRKYESSETLEPNLNSIRQNDCEVSYAPKQPQDKVVSFFLNMGETVKNFPEDVQIRVKREVFKIVNDAEELVYNNIVKDIKVESFE